MKNLLFVAFIALGLGLAACGSNNTTVVNADSTTLDSVATDSLAADSAAVDTAVAK